MYEMPMNHIEFEKKLMDMLLDGDDDVLEGLREQYRNSTVESREFTGVGFFTNFIINTDVPPVAGGRNFVFGDVFTDFGSFETSSGFLLFIKDGYLSMLEGWTVADYWPDNYSGIQLYYHVKVGSIYQPTDERNLHELRKEWG